MRKSLLPVLVACAAILWTSIASAGVVRVWGERYNLNTINNFYDGLAGHSSQIVSGQLDTINLSGVNLLWAVQPADAYTGAELTAMANFLSGGGRIAFMGEHGSFAPNENNRINSALTALGANINIVNNALSCGFRTAERGNGEIVNHPLTTGVNFYQYACFAQLNISGSAQALMYGEADGAGIVMMAYQNIGPGSIFLITDQNVWDNAPNWTGYDNARMFENLLTGRTQVPEPASLALMGLGLAGLAAARRRKAS